MDNYDNINRYCDVWNYVVNTPLYLFTDYNTFTVDNNHRRRSDGVLACFLYHPIDRSTVHWNSVDRWKMMPYFLQPTPRILGCGVQRDDNKSISNLISTYSLINYLIFSSLSRFIARLHTITMTPLLAYKKENLPEKICVVCKRPFTWRKKWRKDWDEVKYCSQRCRMAKSEVKREL